MDGTSAPSCFFGLDGGTSAAEVCPFHSLIFDLSNFIVLAHRLPQRNPRELTYYRQMKRPGPTLLLARIEVK